MNAIEIQNLSRRFGRTDAVHDLSLSVPEGSVFALLGPNGAGKTTTIKILMNLIDPTSGRALVLGVDSRKIGPRERAQIGYVSENQSLPLWMTIRQLLAYCRPFYPTWDLALETTLLEQFDLPAERRLKNLSRGMLMKVALLAALAYRPKLLVLDEPFSGLDPMVRDEFVQGILEASGLGEWTVPPTLDLPRILVIDWESLSDRKTPFPDSFGSSQSVLGEGEAGRSPDLPTRD
ncbi:MAG TPA: ABC transporter ATP-binding protein [Opitutaceae bacterium]|nr:ABC transporter ATP-binding protein [Opitutaceae bacterium]